ncbi:MAG: hypothetical protein ACPGUV_07965 [Polyangiales bacterium]
MKRCIRLKHRPRLFVVVSAMLCAWTAWGGEAVAQGRQWDSRRERVEGPGFRLGNLEVHPGVALEGGYDTNVFFQDTDPVDSFLLRVTPHLFLATLGPERRGEGDAKGEQKVAFRTGLSTSYYHFFEERARSNFDVDTDMRLTLFPERKLGLSFFDTYTRSIRPFTEPGAISRNYNRNLNNVGTEVSAQTRGGGLRGTLGYNFGLDIYEGDSFKYGNNFSHNVDNTVAWRFLANTSVLYDFRYSFLDYRNEDDPAPVALADAHRVRGRVGLNGTLLPRLAFTTMIGYGAGFNDSLLLDEYDSVVAQAELRLAFARNASMRVGYERDFYQALVGGFFRRDRGYLNSEVLFAGVFKLGAEFWAGYLDYGRLVSPVGQALGLAGDFSRTDPMVSLTILGEYRMTDWLGLLGKVGYLGNFSDFEYATNTGAGVLPDPADFQKFDAWLGLRASY